jgi:hypothetical protein
MKVAFPRLPLPKTETVIGIDATMADHLDKKGEKSAADFCRFNDVGGPARSKEAAKRTERNWPVGPTLKKIKSGAWGITFGLFFCLHFL